MALIVEFRFVYLSYTCISSSSWGHVQFGLKLNIVLIPPTLPKVG